MFLSARQSVNDAKMRLANKTSAKIQQKSERADASEDSVSAFAFLYSLSVSARSAGAIVKGGHMKELHVLSYGGGVQSTALLVLAAQKKIHLDYAVFVELDTESPDTILYVHDIALPYAARAGIPLLRVKFSLKQAILDNAAFPPVPFRDIKDQLFGRRQCSLHAKHRPFKRAVRALMRQHGAKRVFAIMGISMDEAVRVRMSDVRYMRFLYPLIDLNLDRNACKDIIAAELPVPPKSSCWFCPYRSGRSQIELIMRYPYLEKEASEIEARVNAARLAQGRDEIRVLRAFTDQANFFYDVCGGNCHT